MSTTQPIPSTPSQKARLAYSRLRPLAPQSPSRHLRSSSSPASTTYSTKTVQSSYPSSGSSTTSLASSTSLSSTSSQPFSTPPSHLPLPRLSFPNLQLSIPSRRDNENENKSFESTLGTNPSTSEEPQPNPLQQSRHIRTSSTIQYTHHAKSQNPKPTKKKFSTAVFILLSLHVLLVSVLVMSWLGHSASWSMSAYGNGGSVGGNDGFADLREWMNTPENLRGEDIASLFLGREGKGFVFEGSDDVVGFSEEDDEMGGVLDEEEAEREGTQHTLEIVLEELKRGHVIVRKSE